MKTGRRIAYASAGLILALLLVTPFVGRLLLARWEDNPILRGRRLAESHGCFACHLSDSGREIPNPESRWGSVPRFRGGNAMMYADNAAEIEEFIRYGAPKSWLSNEAAQRRLERQRIRMPAYGDRLSEQDLADLVSFTSAEEGIGLPGGPQIEAGRALAEAQGCVACHGVEGSGGRPNPGSLGGFIPGFLGRNFRHLVRNEKEFQEWVRTGTNQRLQHNWVVSYFWSRQAIAMPAYGEALDEEQLQQLWSWIQGTRAAHLGSEAE